jgi:hypothetical protein
MNRLAAARAAALSVTAPVALTAAMLTNPASAAAAVNTAQSSIAVDAATRIEMTATADCAGTRCYFITAANLVTPAGPAGLPGDAWSRQTVTLRSNDRDVWQEAWYSAPAGVPRELKGANHNNVLSRIQKSLREVEISVTSFGGGPPERYRVEGDSTPTDWNTGQPATKATFIVCSHIQVVYSGVNLTTPDACAQTTFN